MSTPSGPARRNNSLRSARVASVEPLPGSDNPKASVRQFIELAVNIPEHDPQVGHAARSISVTSSSQYFSSAAETIASTRSIATSLPFSTTLPASTGPPDTQTTGILIRSAATSLPDAILSTLTIHTPTHTHSPL